MYKFDIETATELNRFTVFCKKEFYVHIPVGEIKLWVGNLITFYFFINIFIRIPYYFVEK